MCTGTHNPHRDLVAEQSFVDIRAIADVGDVDAVPPFVSSETWVRDFDAWAKTTLGDKAPKTVAGMYRNSIHACKSDTLEFAGFPREGLCLRCTVILIVVCGRHALKDQPLHFEIANWSKSELRILLCIPPMCTFLFVSGA